MKNIDKGFYKTVMMPIVVSAGDYCWGPGEAGIQICDHFDDMGGHVTCGLNTGDLKYTKRGYVKKTETCLKLKAVE